MGEGPPGELLHMIWHEAGHTVVALRLGFHVDSVDLTHLGGSTRSTASEVRQGPDAGNAAIVPLAGREAERLKFGRDSSFWGDDRKTALSLLGLQMTRQEVMQGLIDPTGDRAQRRREDEENALSEIAARTAQLLSDDWEAVERLSAYLLDCCWFNSTFMCATLGEEEVLCAVAG
jgi:hypothetical protein